ncbi:helix-turn-helix transcriptional regulator [Frankia sp. Mgl5]|uniref:winged helix-turn-helix transcriptional regulator n=1 Tax=Frankia sp. Mgl5 TaxID=2933793 RepID=UPI00200EE42E|nr:helix-turn-helix domain-containing protein [Frankia sp. Mgl5]MCK9932879.1 helix-turn-helix transcriptional regulator [Frankia sp. Mgl5]
MPRSAAPPDGARCSIARSLEVLGERWTLLVVREAFRGRTRFAEFRDALGIATDVLTVRLRTLVEAGVLERQAYREPGSRERYSYHLTPAGHDLRLVLGSLQQWGDTHRPSGHGPATVYRSAVGGEPVRVAFVDGAGAEIDVRDVVSTPGPGWPRIEAGPDIDAGPDADAGPEAAQPAVSVPEGRPPVDAVDGTGQPVSVATGSREG